MKIFFQNSLNICQIHFTLIAVVLVSIIQKQLSGGIRQNSCFEKISKILKNASKRVHL